MSPEDRIPTIKNFAYQVQETDPETELVNLLRQVLVSYKDVSRNHRVVILGAIHDMELVK